MKTERQNFINYFLSFYGEDGIYKRIFEIKITKEEIEKPLLLIEKFDREYDSITRERLRDYILYTRGCKNIEHVDFTKMLVAEKRDMKIKSLGL